MIKIVKNVSKNLRGNILNQIEGTAEFKANRMIDFCTHDNQF